MNMKVAKNAISQIFINYLKCNVNEYTNLSRSATNKIAG